MQRYLYIFILLLIVINQIFSQDITNKLGAADATATYDIANSSNTVLFRVEGNGEVGIGTETPDANLDIHGTVKVFGDWDTSTYSTETVYQAPSDGFVSAMIMNSGGLAFGKLVGYTDENNPPLETHPKAHVYRNFESAGDRDFMHILLPVKKGNYWKISDGASGGNTFASFVYWIPLGQ